MKSLDHRLTQAFYQRGKKNLFFWSQITRRGLFAFAIAGAGIMFFHRYPVYVFSSLVVSVGVAFLITFLLRYAVQRSRPVWPESVFIPWLKKYSFPSAHAAVAFAFATALSYLALQIWESPWTWLGILIFMLAAVTISLSRLFVGVHYVSDVVVGALLGIIVSVILIGL